MAAQVADASGGDNACNWQSGQKQMLQLQTPHGQKPNTAHVLSAKSLKPRAQVGVTGDILEVAQVQDNMI